MAITVDIHEAEAQLSRLLGRAHAGEEIILMNAGTPYARLMPTASLQARRQPGRLKGLIDTSRFFDPLPPDELDAWDGR